MSNAMKLECSNCQGNDFFLQDGLYFCEECNVQYANLVEMEYEEHNDLFQSRQQLRLGKDKSKAKDKKKSQRLTSWEEYNFILIGLVDEILSIQDIPEFKRTCLQLWITFLQRSEAAFFDKDESSAPKLFAVYRDADAEILYNIPAKEKKPRTKKKLKFELHNEYGLDIIQKKKRRRRQMRKSEKLITKQLSESVRSESMNSSLLANMSIESIISDRENAAMDLRFSKASRKLLKSEQRTIRKDLEVTSKPYLLSGRTLLFIIACALNICGSDLQFLDVVRLVREGRLSYYSCRKFLPDHIIEQGIPTSFQKYFNWTPIVSGSFRVQASNFTRIIPGLQSSIHPPDLMKLVQRFLDEMALPLDLLPLIERLMLFWPPVMRYSRSIVLLPNYEGRAMAYILFVLKLIFGLDGYREKEMSVAAGKVNRVMQDAGLKETIFVYEDWKNHMEYRQIILDKFYYPTFHNKYCTSAKPYLAYNEMLNTLKPKTQNSEPDHVPKGHQRRRNCKMTTQEMLKNLIAAHPDEPIQQFKYPFSFTPLKDAFKQILSSEMDLKINRELATLDYTSHSCTPFLEHKKLVEKLKSVKINLHTKKSTFPKRYVYWRHTTPEERIKNYQLELDKMSMKQWRDDLKRRKELEKAANLELDYQQRTKKKIMQRRKNMRDMIRFKKDNPPTSPDTSDSECYGPPRKLGEPKLLEFNDSDYSLSDNDDIENEEKEELDLLFQSHKRALSSNLLTFVRPDYNMWQQIVKFMELAGIGTEYNDHHLDNLPRSFLWILRLAAAILNETPMAVYYQLVCLETQFMTVYKPVELIDNIMLRQRLEEPTNFYQNAW